MMWCTGVGGRADEISLQFDAIELHLTLAEEISLQFDAVELHLSLADEIGHGTYRLSVKLDGESTWHFSPDVPCRLNGLATSEVDELIDAKLSMLSANR